MKHKKTVTDAVRAANRANSQLSTGPRTDRGKSHSRRNAHLHGILARKVVLDTHEQRAEFRKLRRHCKKELHPKGLLEKFVAEEIATIFWKLGLIEPLVFRELSRSQELLDGVDKIFHFSVFHKDLELPIRGDDLPLDRGWDCERMVVRAIVSKDQHYSKTVCGPPISNGQMVQAAKASQKDDHQSVDHLEVEAVMGNALETLTRYQTKLKRDLYRAIDTLRKIQAERREGEK
ncbi:MAG TPA: hypothetical protein VGS27_04890 [Candidatus Sulfotelmatobacter sp.]|nr:hypothetical protein [Candidatus Sulfotelmatobacter sp.]